MTRCVFLAFFLCPAALLAQGVGIPEITPIPGGLFVKWASPVEIAAVQVDKGLSGSFEIMFDVPDVNFIANVIDRKSASTNTPEMVTALADYWIVRGKPERAIPHYERELAQGNLDPARTLVFQNNLAMLYSRVLGQHDRAIEIVDAALETRKDNVALLDTKGLILLNSGNPTEAIPFLERAVVLSCELPIYCMHLAYALHLEGRPGQVRRYFDPARPQLMDAAPTMTKENKEMFDELQRVYPPVQ